MTSTEQHLDARQARRMAAQDRFLGRMEKRERDAEKMVGVLIRDGSEVFYVFPVGGKYREGTESELVNYLIRNNWA